MKCSAWKWAIRRANGPATLRRARMPSVYTAYIANCRRVAMDTTMSPSLTDVMPARAPATAPRECDVTALSVAAEPLDALYVLNSLALGGSEKKTVRIANHLAERGLQVGLVCLNGPDTLRPELSPSVRFWQLERRGKF